jgi:hypothetical protein
MLNKRGQGLSVNAIILIVLGIAVLVFLILGFAMGWEKIVPFLGGDTVDNVVDGCATACLSGQEYNFCTRDRELKVDGDLIAEDNCNNLATMPEYSEYGIDVCDSPSIDCSVETPAEVDTE